MAIGESIIHLLPKRLRWDGQHYFIYALIDPRDNVARYIGMSKDAEFRFYQHLISACSLNTLHWIEELKQLGLIPTLQILETVRRQANMSPSAFKLAACEREAYWIAEYQRLGIPLLNTLGVSRKYPQRGNGPTQLNRSSKVTDANRLVTTLRREKECSVIPFLTNSAAMTLTELIEEALMTNTEVAAEAGLSPGTVSRMVNGHPTSRLSVRKVLAMLNRKLGRKIEIGDIEGLNISD